MHKILITLSSAMLLLFAIGCRPDVVVTETETEITPPVIVYESGVRGKVVDRDGIIITDAIVRWGESTTQTDENGYFSLAGEVAQNAVLTVEKANYYKAIQTITTTNTNIQQTTVQLTPRNLTTTLDATSGGEVAVDGGGKVTFTANSFVDENGAAYSGNVNIYTTYLDPTLTNLNEIMPGNLTAINAEDDLQLLTSFGMINVELEGDAGQILQINQAATLETPVPASILNNAPATIPLWHFNEATGLWEEEGDATLQGDTYVGTVNHFTWWNCDVPTDFILLRGEVNSGIYEPTFKIRITRLSDNTYGILTTDNKGQFSGLVPKNELLLLEVIDLCGAVLSSQQVGEYSADASVGIINVTTSSNDWATVTGNIVNCDNIPTTNGYVIFSTSAGTSNILWASNDGQFSGQFPTCGASEISLSAYDLSTYEYSNSATFAVATNINAGTLAACGNTITEGFSFDFNGTTELWSPCTNAADSSGDGVYSIHTSDVQGSSQVIYTFTIVDWNNNPNDPLFAFNWEVSLLGNNPQPYSFAAGDDDIELISNSSTPGDMLQFQINNATVTNEITSEVATGVTITINALIQ